MSSLKDDIELKETGLIAELPGSIDIGTYTKEIQTLQEEFRTLPHGTDSAAKFEDAIGNLIKFCFYTSLTNVEPRVRNVNGRVIRDWIAGNHVAEGFWEMIRVKYGATNVIWECKNYEDLGADDFQQAAYYMNEAIGRFVMLAYRGKEKKKHYFEHIARIASNNRGLVLLLSEKDLQVFLRHALNGKSNQSHLQELFDTTVRQVS